MGTVNASVNNYYDSLVYNDSLFFTITNYYQFGTPIASINLRTGYVDHVQFTPNAGSYLPMNMLLYNGQVCYEMFYRYNLFSDYGIFSLDGQLVSGTYGDFENFVVRGHGLRVSPAAADSSVNNLVQASQSTSITRDLILKQDVPSQQLIAFDNGALGLFAANSHEVWTTDGTRAGTRLLANVDDIAGAILLGYTNGHLLYAHSTPQTGTEIWVQDVSIAPPELPEAPEAPALRPAWIVGRSIMIGSSTTITRCSSAPRFREGG